MLKRMIHGRSEVGRGEVERWFEVVVKCCCWRPLGGGGRRLSGLAAIVDRDGTEDLRPAKGWA